MIDLSADILKTLAGASAQQPMSSAAITRKLADAGHVLLINELLDDLGDLVKRRAVNTARVSRDGGQTFVDVFWPTGVPPAPMSRGITINKHTQADARAAHEAQARAEASREGRSTQAGAGAASTPLKSPLTPLCKGGENSKETDMPRIAKPAKTQAAQTPSEQPATQHDTPEPPAYRRAPNGAVQAQVYAALAGRTRDSAALADDLMARCPAASGIDSLKSTLRALARSGRIHEERRPIHGVLRGHYWPLEGAGNATPNAATATPTPLNDGHELNLATIRRLAGEDRVAADPVSAAAEALDLDEGEGALRFALWDNGTLMLTQGDEILALPKTDTRRLAEFLEACMAVTL